MFWVATAPLSGSGHVNVSPKGGEYFGLLDDKTFWFLELTGSGCETLSHLHETGNRRITIMLTAFEGAPKIVRLWGKGNTRSSTRIPQHMELKRETKSHWLTNLTRSRPGE